VRNSFRAKLILLLLLLLVLLAGAFGCSQSEPAAPPNFVVLIADDMNWDDNGPYGHPSIRTPNLDRLAREGMLFRNAFLTASSCSPSRSSVITGRYPHNTGAEQLHWPLPADQVTFVEKLKEAGYWTAAAGKWHLGDAVKDRFDLVVEADPSGFQLPAAKDGAAAKPVMVANDASGSSDWIPVMRKRPDGKPFFLWLASLDPHRDYRHGIVNPPHQPEDVRLPPHLPDTPEVREDLALYYDEIARFDDYVGRVLDELEKQGVADNTFVLVFSDNGRPFPRDKTTLYDGGIKTPWIIRWPEVVAPRSVSDSVVSSVDLAPTVLELAGLTAAPTMEGRSFAPILRDAAQTIREYAFAEKHWHDYEDHARAVRSKDFKYIRNDYPDLPNTPGADAVRSMTFRAMQRLQAAGELTAAQQAPFTTPRPNEELYDVRSDPFELHNLAGDPAHEKTLQQFRQELAAWSKRTGDFMPSKRTPDEFDRTTGEPNAARIRPRPSRVEMFGTNGVY
jgi:arylsulfatase A-like enzyme